MENYNSDIENQFISKKNIQKIYKTLINENNYDNLKKKEKEVILHNIVLIMRKTIKKLNFSKINKKNIDHLMIQFNNLCLKDINKFVKDNILPNFRDQYSNLNKFNKINFSNKLNQLPEASKFSNNIEEKMKQMQELRQMNTMQNTPNLHSNKDYERRDQLSLEERMRDLEKNRQLNQDKRPPTPDFLKSKSVGNKNNYIVPNIEQPKTEFKGFTSDSNIVNVNFNTDNNKYNENISIEERLKMMELERSGNHQQPDQQIQQPIQQIQQPIQQIQQPIQQIQQPVQQIQQPVQQYNKVQLFEDKYNIKFNEMIDMFNDMKRQIVNKYNYLQLEINKTQAEYNYKFKDTDNIIGLKLISYSIPEPSYNIDESEIIFEYNNNRHSIKIDRGYYNYNNLIQKLNENNYLHFSLNYKKRLSVSLKSTENVGDDNIIMLNNFKFIDNYIIRKLGFIDLNSVNGILHSKNLIDLRTPSKLKLYILNIDNNQPFGLLNFNGTSICEFNFRNKIKLNNLHIKFTTDDNHNYNFDNLKYNLSFQLITS
jgi:hypothetical protein